jgi:hypothetical protein
MFDVSKQLALAFCLRILNFVALATPNCPAILRDLFFRLKALIRLLAELEDVQWLGEGSPNVPG